ncbi:putative rab [Schistosoma mansoni]|uniref:putative rab n=1 Tax=Schistosoma mansoni TaxID=6183 RepID=UPI00022DC63A|nr:putative rab [Schistosoma mansoni]|eukprot:XP_018651480.1 putative rab [Schistosoma mansoni]
MIKNLEEQDIYPNEFNHQNLIYKSNEQDDSRIIKLQMKILQMNQENSNLEEQLNHIKLQLTQSRSEFNAVRHSLNNKNHELEETCIILYRRMTALIETVKENSALKRQVGLLQDINRKLYDANDDFYNMFESYPEWLRKEWKVEDIKPSSPMIDSRFRRTSTEFKLIKSVVKKFNAHDCEANISTYASCKNDQTEELRSSSYGKGYCVISRCDQPDCCCSKFHGNGAGDSEVGKTSLLIRMCDDIFKNCSVTIGIDVKMKSVEVDGRKAMMQIWDTAGQERFRSVSTSFYRKADGILLVYDCTSESSFISTRDWITIIEENAGKQIPIAIIGNKKDLKEQKEWQGNKCVSYAIGSKLAQEIGALFFETSALTGENVNECLEALASYYVLKKIIIYDVHN